MVGITIREGCAAIPSRMWKHSVLTARITNCLQRVDAFLNDLDRSAWDTEGLE